MKIYVENPDGSDTAYDGVEGWSLMEVLKEYNLPLKAECGGACCCATCHVYIDPAWMDVIAAMNEEEEDMLDSTPAVTDLSRLSCQIILSEELDGLRVKIAPSG